MNDLHARAEALVNGWMADCKESQAGEIDMRDRLVALVENFAMAAACHVPPAPGPKEKSMHERLIDARNMQAALEDAARRALAEKDATSLAEKIKAVTDEQTARMIRASYVCAAVDACARIFFSTDVDIADQAVRLADSIEKREMARGQG